MQTPVKIDVRSRTLQQVLDELLPKVFNDIQYGHLHFRVYETMPTFGELDEGMPFLVQSPLRLCVLVDNEVYVIATLTHLPLKDWSFVDPRNFTIQLNAETFVNTDFFLLHDPQILAALLHSNVFEGNFLLDDPDQLANYGTFKHFDDNFLLDEPQKLAAISSISIFN